MIRQREGLSRDLLAALRHTDKTWASASERKTQQGSCTQRPSLSEVTLPLTRLGKTRRSSQNVGQGCQALTAFLLNGGADRSEFSHGTKTMRVREASSDFNSKSWMHGEPSINFKCFSHYAHRLSTDYSRGHNYTHFVLN